MTPPTSRTWARRGHRPVIRVQGRSLPAPVLDRRPGPLQAGRTLTPGLPAQAARRPQARWPAQLHLDRRPRPAERGPPATRRPLRARLGQSQRALGRPAAGLHRHPRLDHRLPATVLRTRPEPGRRYLVTGPTPGPEQHRLHRPRPPDARPAPHPPRTPIPQRKPSTDASPQPVGQPAQGAPQPPYSRELTALSKRNRSSCFSPGIMV